MKSSLDEELSIDILHSSEALQQSAVNFHLNLDLIFKIEM